MKIAIGTTSEQKISIIKKCLDEKGEQYELIQCEVNSGVADQPIGEGVIITGSINRARNAMQKNESCDFGLGLEGGLCLVNGSFHLVCVASYCRHGRRCIYRRKQEIAASQRSF